MGAGDGVKLLLGGEARRALRMPHSLLRACVASSPATARRAQSFIDATEEFGTEFCEAQQTKMQAALEEARANPETRRACGRVACDARMWFVAQVQKEAATVGERQAALKKVRALAGAARGRGGPPRSDPRARPHRSSMRGSGRQSISRRTRGVVNSKAGAYPSPSARTCDRSARRGVR